MLFNKQRFQTRSCPFTTNVTFDESFLFTISDSLHDDFSDIEQILSLQEKIIFIVVKEDSCGDKRVLSREVLEWRKERI